MDELAFCLKDAGCGAERIAEICRLYDIGDTEAVKRKLRRYRCELMDALHESQERVDRLDYLLYRIERSERTEKRNG